MTDNNFTIRQAVKADVASLALLMDEMGYPTTEAEMSRRFTVIDLEPHYITLVADYDGVVVGMAGASKGFYFEKNGCYIRLIALVVSNHYREKGIGKVLIHSIEEWAKTTNANAIVLNCGTREERKGAHVFYQHLGFEAKSTGYVKRLMHT